jgi:hypothetical protein
MVRALALLILCLAILQPVTPARLSAQSDLDYQNRGDRHEGVKSKRCAHVLLDLSRGRSSGDLDAGISPNTGRQAVHRAVGYAGAGAAGYTLVCKGYFSVAINPWGRPSGSFTGPRSSNG